MKLTRALLMIEKALRWVCRKDPDHFLRKVSGVIHVGANSGQERDLYACHKLHVVWIEPIPEVFEALSTNIENYPNQIAFQRLLTDQDGAEHVFHIANNGGASSSILELKLHKDIWPGVDYEKSVKLRSTTLDSLIEKEQIDIGKYDALIMDTQGSELLVLKGAVSALRAFRFVKTEVPDFESYVGCCQLKDIDSYLRLNGFREISRHKFAEHKTGGSYFDVIYERDKRSGE
jgi:FkbM family methyltransferase